MTHSLSVLVPALNEERDLEATVRQLIRVVASVCEDFEIIIVNDGSTDATGAVATRLARTQPRVRVVENPRNMGLGYSYARGVREARKSHFVYVPGDNTWPEHSIGEILRHMGKADVVTSYATNPEVRVGFRRVISTAYTTTLNALFGLRMRYFNGLSVYPRRFLLTSPVTTWGFGFQAETLLKAIHAGLSVVEVGVPIDEAAARRSRALSLRNFLSVAKTVITTFWALRVARRRMRASVAQL
jgi:dolichol-phosphate mannosyltransferase